MWGVFHIITAVAIVALLPNIANSCTVCPTNPHTTPREDIYCQAYYVVKVRLGSKGSTGGPMGVTNYNFYIDDVYKGPEEFQAGNALTLLSAKSSMQCGVTWLEEGHTYVIAGPIPYPGLGHWLTICQWVVEYSELSRREMKGLRGQYGEACSRF